MEVDSYGLLGYRWLKRVLRSLEKGKLNLYYRFTDVHLLSPEGCFAVIGPVFIQGDDFSVFQFSNAGDMKWTWEIPGVNPDNCDNQIFAFYDTFNRSISVAGVVAIRANIVINGKIFVCAMPANTRVFAEVCREFLTVLCQDIFPKCIYFNHVTFPFLMYLH